MRARALLAGLRLQGRIVRSEPALAIAVLLAALVAAVLVASGSRLLHQVSEDDLRQATASGAPERRSVRVETDRRIGAAPTGRDPFEFVDRNGQRFLEEEIPASVGAVIAARHFVVESPPFLVSSFPGDVEGPFPTAFRFRYQDGIDEQLTIVDGRLPAGEAPVPMLQGPDCPAHVDRLATGDFEPDEGQDCRAVEVPVYEVVVTAETADAMMLDIGDRALLAPDRRDPAWRFVRPDHANRRIILSISGIVELTAPTAEYWYDDSSLHRPRITENADYRLVFAAGVFAPDQYWRLLRDVPETHFDYTWRYLVAPDLLDPEEASDLRIELDKLRAARTPAITLLPSVIETYLAQRRLTITLMSTTFTGVLVVSGVAVFVLASLAGRRQVAAIRLVLERGARPAGLIVVAAVHGLTVGVAAGIVALLVAAVAVPAGPWTQPVLAAGAVALTTALAVVGATVVAVGAARRVASPTLRAESGGLAQARRIVRDASIVVVGGTAILLVRQRSSAVQPDDPAAFDPLGAAAPVLFGFAVGVVMLWLSGPVARVLARLGGHHSGLTAFLGFRRLLGQSRAARSAMMVILLATGLAGFAIAVQASVAEAQRANAWQLVGADLAVRGHGDGVPVPPAVAASVADLGVSTAAAVELPSTAVLSPEGPPHLHLLAIDADAYRGILADSPTDPDPLDALLAVDAPGGTVPAIVSQYWPGNPRPAVGDDVEILLRVRESVRVAATADRFPSIPLDAPFLIVDLDRLAELDDMLQLDPTVWFIDAPPGAPDEVVAAVTEASPISRVLARDAVLADSTGDPFIAWVGRGMIALAAVAAAAAIVAAAAGLAISAPARRRELALLAAMGLRRRQAAWLTAIEFLVPTILALAAGTGLALLLVELVTPTLELSAFAGGPHPVVPRARTAFSLAFGGAVLAAVAATSVVVVRSEAVEGAGRDGIAGEE